jgi:hypothetical protein
VTQPPGFPAVWLRHNCPCPDCRDPVTGQRLIEITDIPNGTGATVTAHDDSVLEVTFTLAVLRRSSSARTIDAGSFPT